METYEANEYDHFIAFVYNKLDGTKIVVQYRTGQVWKDEAGVWQVRDAQEPSYSFVDYKKREQVKFSPTILNAFANIIHSKKDGMAAKGD